MKQKMAFLDFEDEGELEGTDGAFTDAIVEPVYRSKTGKSMGNKEQRRAPTLTIEVVRVNRPLKVLSLLLAIASLALMLVASCLSPWMHTGPVHMGLFQECIPCNDSANNLECSATGCLTVPFFICMILAMVGMGLLLLGITLFIGAILTYALVAKRRLYNATVTIFIFATLIYTACIVAYPVFFLLQITDEQFQPEGHSHGDGKITPGYALFIGVAGVLTLLVSTILLVVDKRVDELVYREKINH